MQSIICCKNTVNVITRKYYFVEVAYLLLTMRKNTFLPCQCGAAVSLLVAVSDDDYMECYDISI